MTDFTNINVNLSKNNESFFEKFINFGLGYGFLIIAITTGFVVACSFYKIKTDNELLTLNKKISNLKTEVESKKKFEEEFNFFQEKLNTYVEVENENHINAILPKISLVTPENVILNDLTIDNKQIIFNGISLSQDDINYLYNNIFMISEKDPDVNFENFSIDKIENKDAKNPGYNFTLAFDYKLK